MGTMVPREDVPEEADGRERQLLRSAADAEALLLDVVGRHAEELMRVARRHSLCADDAHDAYQRSLEHFLRHGRRLRADSAHKWLFTVCKREAQAVRRTRGELVGWDDVDLDRLEARHATSPEDRVIASDDVARSAEALRGLKPAEVKALWLRASGRSYAEIQHSTGWSYTNFYDAPRPSSDPAALRESRPDGGSPAARAAGRAVGVTRPGRRARAPGAARMSDWHVPGGCVSPTRIDVCRRLGRDPEPHDCCATREQAEVKSAASRAYRCPCGHWHPSLLFGLMGRYTIPSHPGA